MGQLIEVIFEGLTPRQATNLCHRIGGTQATKLVDKIDDNSNATIETPIGELILSQTTRIIGAHLRLLRYEQGPLDVELNFELEDVIGPKDINLQRSLRDFAKTAADAAGVTTYFAGLEPAVDKDTRLFTGPDLGPINLR